MKKIYTILLLLFLITNQARSQTHGNISLEIGVPLNDFHREVDDIGAGIKGAVYFPFQKNIPVFFGFGVGYMIFGTNRQDINENLQVMAGNTVISNIPIHLLVQTNNNFVNGHLSVRYKAPLEIVQPYMEARAGFNNFYTRTKVIDETENYIFTPDNEDHVINSKTQVNSTTFNYGLEGGFIIRFGRVGINIGAAYLIGGKAKYYDKTQISQWTVQFSGSGSFNPENVDPETVDLVDNSNAEPKRSTTDLLLVNAGITFGVGTKAKNKRSAPKTGK